MFSSLSSGTVIITTESLPIFLDLRADCDHLQPRRGQSLRWFGRRNIGLIGELGWLSNSIVTTFTNQGPVSCNKNPIKPVDNNVGSKEKIRDGDDNPVDGNSEQGCAVTGRHSMFYEESTVREEGVDEGGAREGEEV